MIGHDTQVGQISHTKNQRAVGPGWYEVGAGVRSNNAARSPQDLERMA